MFNVPNCTSNNNLLFQCNLFVFSLKPIFDSSLPLGATFTSDIGFTVILCTKFDPNTLRALR